MTNQDTADRDSSPTVKEKESLPFSIHWFVDSEKWLVPAIAVDVSSAVRAFIEALPSQ